MQRYPNDLYEKLEFDKVIELLKNECYGELAKVYFDNLELETERLLIEKRLSEVDEYKLSIDERDTFPLREYEDLHQDLKMLSIPGSVMTMEGLLRLYNTLQINKNIYAFFTETRQEVYHSLYAIIKNISFNDDCVKAIDRVIDEEGNVRPDASPELQRIRRSMSSKYRELDRAFRSVIGDFKQKGYLTDNIESFRNGRRVLSVPAEYKRQVRGIIHDQSATGKTAFIEPEAVIDINNDIFDLHQAEKREIYKILKDLSEQLRLYVPLFRSYQGILLRFDAVQAKAQLAVKMDANKPKLLEEPCIGVLKGFHPLLYLKNSQLGKDTVPFDLNLLFSNRLLVLSGPNAGGKSIAMKAVGLMQMMVQAGMLVPVDPLSEMGIFKKMFVDIGDQQSLEDELSTYSSRLKNMRFFLENADQNTLILIDEFGSGTDPKIGGAIAEAILHEFYEKKVFGVITTHYSNLKVYAFKTKGIVNGAMEFDKDTLSPTYRLNIGRPGSSYAFEIAEKSGLSKKILKYARNHGGGGKSTKAVDELLVDLQREKQEVGERLKRLTDREKHLERLIKNYDTLHKDLEFKRKKQKLEAKEQALQNLAHNNRDLENLIRELRESKKLEDAKKLAARIKSERQELASSVSNLNDEVYEKMEPAKADGPIKEGDHVKMRNGNTTGQVEVVQKNKAIVVFGSMKMTVKLKDLQKIREPLDVKRSRINLPDNGNQEFDSKIDIRGMRVEDAMKTVETFVDQALLSNASFLRIVHGKGSGVLRKIVRKKLKEYDSVSSIVHPEENQGGEGVTIAYLE